MQKIILIGGKATHGKDTSAQIIKRYLEKQNKNVIIIHFADELKFYAKEYFGWNGNKDENGRKILQILGTDIVRSKNYDYWVESVARFIQIFKDDFDYFIVCDCRFPNEIDYFRNKDLPVITLKVIRINYKSSLTLEQQNHPSETSLDNYEFDYVMFVDEGLDILELEVKKFIEIFEL